MGASPSPRHVYKRGTVAFSLLIITVGAVVMTTAPKGNIVQVYLGLAIFLLGGFIIGVAGIRARQRGTLTSPNPEEERKAYVYMGIVVPATFVVSGLALGLFELPQTSSGNWLGIIAATAILMIGLALFLVINRIRKITPDQ